MCEKNDAQLCEFESQIPIKESPSIKWEYGVLVFVIFFLASSSSYFTSFCMYKLRMPPLKSDYETGEPDGRESESKRSESKQCASLSIRFSH